MSFSSKRLGEICRIEYGRNLPSKIRALGNTNVYGSNGIVGTHDMAFTSGKTVIIGRKGSIGEVHVSNSSCWAIDTTYYIDETLTECDLDWLAFLLKHLKLDRLNKASGVPGLNRDDVYNLVINVPSSIAKQQKIAFYLQSQFAEIEKAREAILIQQKEVENLANAIIYDSLNAGQLLNYSLGNVLNEV